MPSFCKEERLCNNKHILLLQKEAKVFFRYPFTIKWIEILEGNEGNIRILPTVPKRNFKKAIDRNKIKRLIREAYRLNKEILIKATQYHKKNIVIMLHYSGKNIVTYKETESKIVLILQQIADSL